METMTAEQALSNAKSHTFESVWATLDRIAEENERRKREFDERYEQYKAENERRKREADERYEKYERERREADEKRKAEDERRKREFDERYEQYERERRESQEKTEKMIAELSRNIGGLGNSFGRFTEAMLS
ncbi:MAG: hypothetical protein LBI44_05185, partial [Oscillospiraceae bacterium]|nr:hypothetical protein [Oscillospiraceae bacterium]